jgi:hypothetical protein
MKKRVMAPQPSAGANSGHGKGSPDSEQADAKQHGKQPCDGGGNVAYGKHAKMPVLASDLYAEVEIPDLGEFNPDDIRLDATIVAIGKRRTGKSWIFRDLMYHMKDKISAGIVISQTDDLNKFWRQYIPAKYIYPKYEPEILDTVFKRQKAILNDAGLTEEQKEKQAPFFVLLDDVISDQRLKYDSNLMELFVAGRHYKLFVLITTQYAKAITPTIRGNTDYCFMLKCFQKVQRECLWENFADFLTRDAFNQILEAYTEDNEALVVNTCPESDCAPLEMMCWWKAVDPGKFKMGTKEYWESSMTDNYVPPKEGPQSALELLQVRDFTPAPWSSMMP